jgi:hypothetical protein
MTPAQLYDGILKAMNDKETIDLIEKAKMEWEFEGFMEGWDKCEKVAIKAIRSKLLKTPPNHDNEL